MQIIAVTITLLASLASARDFTLYDNSYWGGASHRETRNDDDACCIVPGSLLIERYLITDSIIGNMNGKGDRASSVKGYGCTTFYR